jgi:hypothetical protein
MMKRISENIYTYILIYYHYESEMCWMYVNYVYLAISRRTYIYRDVTSARSCNKVSHLF